MTKSPVPYAAACQVDQRNPATRADIKKNAQRLMDMMERAVVGYRPFFDVRLVVFPEFALSAPVYATAPELLEKLAMPTENEHVERIALKAKELGCYVQTGSFLETDPRWPDLVFNTTLLISPEGRTLLRYRKANPWIPWEVHASPHDIPDYPDEIFPVADTELGKIGVATCYDWLFPEVTRELALRGAEILVRISAYMDPWGATAPMDWWTLVNRTRALENTAFVVAANQAASFDNYPPFSWPGGSMIVDYDGRVLAEASPGAGAQIVTAPIAVDVLRAERARRIGHSFLAHRRTGIYRRAKDEGFPPQIGAERHTVESLTRAVEARKDASSIEG